MTARIDAESRAVLLAGTGAKVALRRNRRKPVWQPDELHRMLSVKLEEEARELQFALRHESRERQIEEAQDLVAVAAIILDLVTNQ